MLDRRSLLFAAAAAALPMPAYARPAFLPLWPGDPPGGGGPTGALRVDRRGAISNLVRPSLDVYVPDDPNGAAVLVAAGGGYQRIEMAVEARPAAAWLAGQGVTAFVLSYRLPQEGWRAGPMAPLQDAQRALRIMRAQHQLDPQRIGVLGFSSGGHLLGLAATRSAFRSYEAVDASDDHSARPNFAALIYPIVTLEPPLDNTETRRALIGAHPTPAASAEWSVQTHVQLDTPPMFLAQAEDDPISDPQNTHILESACRRVGTPAEWHLFRSGGHGFGLGYWGTPVSAWPDLYSNWLVQRGVLSE